MASVCVGAFALAAAGLLDGRNATTHWEFADELAARFPAVRVTPEVLYVDEGPILTSAGIAAGVDLCLYMVRCDYGALAATEVSRRMVAPVHRAGGQAQFMERPVPDDETRSRCDPRLGDSGNAPPPDSLRTCPARRVLDPDVRAAIRRRGGATPLRWLTNQRLLEARRLLEATELPVEEVAWRCGLGTAANLRLHLARDASITPTAYRNTFRGGATRPKWDADRRMLEMRGHLRTMRSSPRARRSGDDMQLRIHVLHHVQHRDGRRLPQLLRQARPPSATSHRRGADSLARPNSTQQDR